MIETQLLEILEANDIFDKFQSGFRKKDSTESALPRVTNDILMHADSGERTLLLLLDLSAAFDTVDHRILIDRLRHYVWLGGTALQWFSSYISNRIFSVSVVDFVSSSTSLSSGFLRVQSWVCSC
ncbi:hypothetical protein LDENG_00212130 [Lucifuga dentata]|nr:hypothetical protein LDENG_00212130 [Lucifuga dentata]